MWQILFPKDNHNIISYPTNLFYIFFHMAFFLHFNLDTSFLKCWSLDSSPWT